MTGDVRFGTFSVFMGGLMVAYGIDTIGDNLWYGIVLILLGVVLDVSGMNRVDNGVKEAIRLHDLEKAAKANTKRF